jgi:hypothetical protein
MANDRELGIPLPRAPELRTWDGVKSWGDILDPRSKEIIRDVLAKTPKERLCPYLREIVEGGNIEWVYCQVSYNEAKSRGCTEGDKPSYSDPRYGSVVDCTFLQLFCASRPMRGTKGIRFEKCIEYISEEGRKRRETNPSSLL